MNSSEVSILRKFLRILKSLTYSFLARAADAMICISEHARIQFQLKSYVSRRFDDYYLRQNFSKLISKIFTGKIIHLDVGASAGPLPVVQKYLNLFDIIL